MNIIDWQDCVFLDTELPIDETDDNFLEGAVGGEIEHHASQEQTDVESDSKGDLWCTCIP